MIDSISEGAGRTRARATFWHRESGAIEQDADVVGLLYKPKSGSDDDEGGGATSEEEAVPVNLLMAKQRNGPTGDVHFTFLRSYTRFESAAKVSDEDVPN